MASRRGAIGAIALACGALGGSAPALAAVLPTKAKDYSTSGYQHGVQVTMITSATHARRIEAGGAPIGSQFPTGGIYVRCSKAPRSVLFTPFITIPFAAITLKLSHHHYGFSRKFGVSRSIVGSSLAGPFALTVTFTGTVRSSKLIAGTVRVTGPQCASNASYSAKLTKQAVAPGT